MTVRNMSMGSEGGRRLLGAVVGLVIAGLAVSACTSSSSTTTGAPTSPGSSTSGSVTSSAPSSPTTPASSTSSAPSSSAVALAPVHIRLLEDDTYGPVTYGVGMPIVAYFSAKFSEAKDFEKATTVTVNGQPNAGSWWFESSAINPGYPVEAHYRPAPTPGSSTNPYWPAHATIQLTMDTKGVSAGPGKAFDDSLTLGMKTGDAHISTVNCSTEQMVVKDDGKIVHRMPTSCGEATEPTFTGVKVVLQKGEDAPGTDTLRPDGAVRMIGTGADKYDVVVPWSVRVTNSGEYIHAASWNGGNIGRRSTSNGCTNLNTDDAIWFYKFAVIGDVVTYSDTGGKQMPPWDGFGDWNVPQAQWNTGGIVPTA